MGPEDALAASGRGANKEGRRPVSGDRADFKKDWRGGSDPDQDYRDQHDHKGHNRVHRDAKRAVVGVAIGRMDVHYLDHGEKCEQNQAHNSCQSQSSLL
jgi:hypothetical protein